MIQLLNDIWISLNSINPKLINIILIPATIVEYYLFMLIISACFNINITTSQKNIYIILMSAISLLLSNLLPSPFNIFINYSFVCILVKTLLNLSLLKSIVALVLSIFIFGILNILLQKPYLYVFNISLNELINTPIYRISFLLVLYTFIYNLYLIFKKFHKSNFSLDFLDILDKKTIKILYINLLVGFLTLCIQLIINTFFIDIVPIIISLLSFILLLSFFGLSIYSFSRMIKLATTKKDLECAEEYNKSLEILYDKVKGFNHDFNNIVSTLDGYIENNDLIGLKTYFNEIKKDCKMTNNLSILNPRIINNPGIYSLLNNKYFKACNSSVTFEINFFLDLNSIKINIYEFSRILGILIDNAIEEAEKCENKLVRLTFRNEQKNNKATILIENTYSNKNVDIEKIFLKGESGKNNHSGIGLWEVRKYILKNNNLELYTSKTNELFKQKLSIYN